MTEREVIPTRIRVDMMRQYTAEELEPVVGDSESGFLAIESGSETGKFHLQGIVWSARKADTIRERIKSHLGPFNSPTNYSVSSSFNLLEAGPARSVERYAQYCLKGFTARGLGDQRIYWSKNIKPERFEELNKAYWDLNASISIMQRNSKQDKREVLKLLKENVDTSVIFSPKGMAYFIIDYCASNDIRVPHPSKIQEYVNTLMIYQINQYIEMISPTAPKELQTALGYRAVLMSKLAELGTPHYTNAQQIELQTAVQLVYRERGE